MIGPLAKPDKNRILRREVKERFREQTAMTIALGFRCSGGVVLCSDSQLTDSVGLKYNGPKIFAITRPNAGCAMALCYSGYPDIMALVHEKAKQAFSELPSPDEIELRPIPTWNGAFRNKLEDILKEIYSTHGTDRFVELLCAVQSNGEGISLYRATLTVVRPVSTEEYMGIGDSSVIRFLSDLLAPRKMTIRQGLVIGCYMVAQAKTYTEGCGGPTQALVMTDGGKTIFLDMHGLESRALLRDLESEFSKAVLQVSWPSSLEHDEGLTLFDDEEDAF